MALMGYRTLAAFSVVMVSILQYPIVSGSAFEDEHDSMEESRASIRNPEIRIDLGIDDFQAQVEFEKDCSKVIRGEIYCFIPAEAAPMQTVLIELTSYCEGFETSNPHTLVFDKSTDVQPFNFTIDVESVQKAGRYLFLVAGVWRYHPGTSSGEIDSAEGILKVMPYGAISCGMDQLNITADIGEWAGKGMTIRNVGNCECTVDLALDGVPPGIEVEINHDPIEFTAYGQVTLNIRLRQEVGPGRTHSFSLIGINSVKGKDADFEIEILFTTEDDALSEEFLTGASVLLISTGAVLIIIFIGAAVVLIIRRVRKKHR